MSTRQQPKKSKTRRKTKRAEPKQSVKTISVPLAKTQVVSTVRSGREVHKGKPRRQLVMVLRNVSAFRVNNGIGGTGYLRLNPSNQTIFPSLAFEAANYDMYRFKRLRVFYSPIAASTIAGKVAMMWDADSQDAPPTSRVQIPEYNRSVDSAVYQPCEMSIPTDNKWRFINDTNVVDRKLCDFGQILVAVYSGATTDEVGDIWIEYEVEFKDPQPTSTMVQTGQLNASGFTTTGPSYLQQTDIGFTASTVTANFRSPGTFVFTFVVSSSTSGNVTFGGNSTLIGSFRAAVSSGQIIVCAVLDCTGDLSSNPSFQITGSAGITNVQWVLTRCSNANALTSL